MFLPDISENILLFISGFGILQAVLLSCLLNFHQKSDRAVNRFLALYIICISFPMFLPILQRFLSWQAFIFLAPFTLLIGPALYLYIRSFKERIGFRKAWPHLILAFFYIIIIWQLVVTVGRKYPSTPYLPEELLQNPLTIIPISIRFIQMLLYYYLSRKELNAYQHSIQLLYSETSRINLAWVRWLITGYLILVCTTVLLYSILLWHPQYFNLLILINAATFTPYIYIVTYKGMTQPTIWQIQPGMNQQKLEQDMLEAEETERKQYDGGKPASTGNRLNDNKLNEIAVAITRLMNADNLYLEPELTLQHLANKLNIPPYQVSQAINEGLKKTFYELVNNYRVNEAKRLLLDHKNANYTVLAIGFEAGFNSKTTFNTVFKKFTGQTPTEFRDKQKAPLTQS
ncbi:MAG TPA: helix-turn-helix domain-containing protein [Chitinophagaceae bacterium]|nr:helix-turn-helix domain-containing protein [Chitinophagaceae bacterium]